MCSFCSIKCCFIFFNMLFLASGVALIIIGVQQHSSFLLMGTFAMNSLSKFAIVLIAVGVTITLVSLLGLLGAFFNNQPMVSCFICILIVIIIVEILTGAVFYVFGNKLFLLKMKIVIDNKTRKVIHDYSPEKRHAIEKVQEKFQCCGADGPTDWSSSEGWENHDAVPDSCCVVKSQGCGQDKDKVRAKGCIKAIQIFLRNNLLSVAAVCITLGIAEVLGVVVGVCLCLNIKRKSYENMS
ncbi:CD63 antigen-like [Anoplopoma fimbria]|uniref:CD63 antigen-like n=1 Tax=Anoplopoma fimbria TaxID=229290 RepID=UPI0023ED87F3|nr:CD63 antigen-like [Anoplopoma fimbria]